jgi:DNA recombination protein RmuC
VGIGGRSDALPVELFVSSSVMLEWGDVILGVIVGAALGSAAAAAWFLARRGKALAELANAQARAALLDEQARQHVAEIERVRADLGTADQARETAAREAAVLAEQVRQHGDEATKLAETFAALGARALAANNDQFLTLAEQKLAPFKELLERQSQAVSAIELKRESAFGSIEQRITQISQAHDRLSTATNRLENVLRRPGSGGKWGQFVLRNVVECAGMTKHCDFDEQVSKTWSGETTRRPDLVVYLPKRGVIPVDAKVSMDAYMEADSCADLDKRAELLQIHAQNVAKHVTSLASKEYWKCFPEDRCPRLVIMFMPSEPALHAALDQQPLVYEDALRKNVLIATPSLLMAYLHAVASGWQDEDVAANLKEIARAGKVLYERLAVFTAHFEKIGTSLRSAGDTYDKAVGSLEKNLLSGARSLKELHATEDAEIETPPKVNYEPRSVAAAELKQLAADAPIETLLLPHESRLDH